MTELAARLTSRKVLKWLPWVSGLILLAGVVAVLLTYFRNTGTSLQTPLRNEPAQVVKEGQKVPLERQAKIVAGRFILSAVARHDLRAAYKLAGPQIRQGMTLKEWMTGNIPVVPFPVRKVDIAPMQILASHKRDALLRVALLPESAKGQLFYIGLIKVGKGKKAHWLVNSWVPWNATLVPNTGND